MKLSVLLLGILTACGGSSGGDGSLPKASYRVDGITNMSEVGEVFAFNATGQIVSHSEAHGWTVIDVGTKVFAQITGMTGFVGFDDAGALLYSDDRVGATRYVLRLDGGVGSESLISRLLPDGAEFNPYTLTASGEIWGVTERVNPGAPVTPGFGRYAADHVEQFRDWAGHDPTNQVGQGPRGVDADGRAVFCENLADNSGQNGLAQTFCRIAAVDNTLTEIGSDVPMFWSVLTLRAITPGGRLGGSVAVGNRGFGGTFPALFTATGTELLGDTTGDVLGLTDRGDVVFTQLHLDQPVRVRAPSGEVTDLTPYLINPNAPDAEVLGGEVLAIASDGRILVAHAVLGTPDVAVELLTPE